MYHRWQQWQTYVSKLQSHTISDMTHAVETMMLKSNLLLLKKIIGIQSIMSRTILDTINCVQSQATVIVHF